MALNVRILSPGYSFKGGHAFCHHLLRELLHTVVHSRQVFAPKVTLCRCADVQMCSFVWCR